MVEIINNTEQKTRYYQTAFQPNLPSYLHSNLPEYQILQTLSYLQI